MKNRYQLSDWAIWVYESKWVYGMSCYGQRLQAEYARLKSSWYYTVKNPSGFKKLTALYNAGANPRLYDCHGIVDGFRMDDITTDEIEFDPSLDTSANYEMERVKATGVLGKDYGPIDANMKDNAGYGYWKDGHFGVGVGDGLVIDIWNTGYPARKRDQTLGNWTNWLRCYGIAYEGEDMIVICKRGDGSSKAPDKNVMAMQSGLVKLKYKMINDDGKEFGADGSYGGATANGLNQFLTDRNIASNGDTYDDRANSLMLDALCKLETGVPQEEYDRVVAENTQLEKEKNELVVECGKLGIENQKLSEDLASANKQIKAITQDRDAKVKELTDSAAALTVLLNLEKKY